MSWACAVTFWHQQEDVIEQLVTKGFEYFFPRIKRTVRHRGKRVHRFDPLLFNYLPVRLSHQDDESIILNLRRGETRLVMDMIGPVRSGEIEALRSRCDRDGIMVIPKKPRFKPGQPVRPLTGPLSTLVGTFVGESPDEREAALFSILGARRSIKFTSGELAAV